MYSDTSISMHLLIHLANDVFYNVFLLGYNFNSKPRIYLKVSIRNFFLNEAVTSSVTLWYLQLITKY